jgi:transposase
VQRFRKTSLFKVFRPFFPPVQSVEFQTGESIPSVRRNAMGLVARRVAKWLNAPEPARSLFPRKTRRAPSEPFHVSDALWSPIDGQLPPAPPRARVTNRMILSAVLTVIADDINWDQLPKALGLGAGANILRRLRRWMKDRRWDAVVKVLREHPDTAHLDLARLEERRRVGPRRRRS